MDSCTNCEFLNHCKKNKIAICPENIIICRGSFLHCCDTCTKKQRQQNRKNGIFCKYDKIDYINGIVMKA